MGASYLEITLEWDEPNASGGCSRFPESSPGHPQGSGSFGCSDNLGMLANVSLRNLNTNIYSAIIPLLNFRLIDCSSCLLIPSDPNLRPSFSQLTAALKPLQRLVIPSHLDQPNSPLPQEISVNSTP